jgi:hypothetical protein
MKFHGIEMAGKFKNQVLSSLPPWTTEDEGREIYLTDGTRWFGTDTKWVGYGSGSSGTSFDLWQPEHDFSVLDAVYYNGSSWVKAKADNENTLGTHIVVDVKDLFECTIAQSGRFNIEEHGLTYGEYYFVSDAIDGGLTLTEPSIYSNPLVFVENWQYIHVLPFRPSLSSNSSSQNSGTSFNLNQISHGFSVLDAVYYNGTSWVKAKADNENTLGTHIVINIQDDDNCTIAQSGRFNIEGHGLVNGEYYFVSGATNGNLTLAEPNMYSNPLVFVEDDDYIHVLPFRPSLIGDDNVKWKIIDSNYTCINNDKLFLNSNAHSFTIFLPINPSIGYKIKCVDGTGSCATNNVTINRNGNRIQGLENNLIINTNNESKELVFMDNVNGWRIIF